MKKLINKIAFRTREAYYQTRLKLVDMKLIPSHTEYKRFAIVCNIRTGSTMLTSFLENHPNVKCFFELFHRDTTGIPFGVDGYYFKGSSRRSVDSRNCDPVSFLSDVIYCGHEKGIEAVGFKLLYPQARNKKMWWNDIEHWWDNGYEPLWAPEKKSVWEYLRDERIAIIHLTRTNQLESAVSASLAHQTGKWGIGATGGGSKHEVTTKISMDPGLLKIDFEANQRMIEEANQWFEENPVLHITYEEMIADKDHTLMRVQKFLGLKNRVSLNTKTQKQNQQPLSESIENYTELKEKFQHTAYSFMFE